MMKLRGIVAIVATIAAINSISAAEQSIVLASTTSVEASGLLANILPQFTARTGITVSVVAQGTGKALDTARRGDADLLLVHDPEAEQQFMDEGHGSTRRQIAWNDFIIVGPSVDPAHVKGGNDSVAALKAIAACRRRSSRVATKAVRMRPSYGFGSPPVKRRTRSAKRNGIATSAAAWGRHPKSRARWTHTRCLTVARGSVSASRDRYRRYRGRSTRCSIDTT